MKYFMYQRFDGAEIVIDVPLELSQEKIPTKFFFRFTKSEHDENKRWQDNMYWVHNWFAPHENCADLNKLEFVKELSPEEFFIEAL